MFLSMIQQNPAPAMMAQFTAGAQGAARSAWIEINRPLTSLGLIQPTAGGVYVVTAGNTALALGPTGLPIGMDIKSITCIASDVDAGWLAVNLTLGSLNLVNGAGGPINLSMFDPRLEHQDRLAPWILSKTRVDVQAQATLWNGAFGYDAATGVVAVTQPRFFHGFTFNAFQEEQVCAITTRIEPTDRNVGVADLINLQRTVLGGGLNLATPAYLRPPAQVGASMHAMPILQQVGPHADAPHPRPIVRPFHTQGGVQNIANMPALQPRNQVVY